jgi:hypothetical protein
MAPIYHFLPDVRWLTTMLLVIIRKFESSTAQYSIIVVDATTSIPELWGQLKRQRYIFKSRDMNSLPVLG